MSKSPLKPFEIEIQGLSLDQHSFDFSFGNDFFGAFEGSLIEKGEGSVHLELIKSETMLTLSFEIEGAVELICDRSLQPFNFPIEIREELMVKYGEEYAELDDDLIVVPRETQHLNVAQFIYEFVTVTIPMKKIHPDLVAADDEEMAGSLVYTTSADEPPAEDDGQPIDPRWEALKKFRNN